MFLSPLVFLDWKDLPKRTRRLLFITKSSDNILNAAIKFHHFLVMSSTLFCFSAGDDAGHLKKNTVCLA